MRGPFAFASALLLVSSSAAAQTVSVGGALELTIEGEVDFEIEFADEDFGFSADGEAPREWFFNQDHEIEFEARASADRFDMEYGVNLQVENAGGSGAGFDEAWIFFEGSFGELHLGDDDDIYDFTGFAFGAATVARGTGGVDGDQRTAPEFELASSGEATKILYFSPVIFGFSGAFSYAIDADDRGTNGGGNEATDLVTLGGNYQGSLFGVDVGGFAAATRTTVEGDGKVGWAIGGLIGAFGIDIAGQYGDEDGDFPGDALDGQPRENFWNIGIGGDVANYGLSFNFQRDKFRGDHQRSNYIIGGDTGILPGVSLRGEAAYVREDGDDDISGFNGLVQVHTEF